MVWWMDQRGFQSSCRVCGCWKVQNKHWVPIPADGPTGTQSNSGYWEACTPSDNLEFLEYKYERGYK